MLLSQGDNKKTDLNIELLYLQILSSCSHCILRLFVHLSSHLCNIRLNQNRQYFPICSRIPLLLFSVRSSVNTSDPLPSMHAYAITCPPRVLNMMMCPSDLKPFQAFSTLPVFLLQVNSFICPKNADFFF